MLGNLAKRAVNLAVLLLAAVAFFLVPFGRRTLYRHLVAVFSSEPAQEMKREVQSKSKQIAQEVKNDVLPAPSSSGSALASPKGGL